MVTTPGNRSARERWPRRALRVLLAVAVVVAIFGFALPQIASAGSVWHAIGHVGWRSAVLLAAAASWNVVTYWFVWMAALPGLGIRRSALVVHAPTAVASTIPGGSYVSLALTYRMLRSWGYHRSDASVAMVVTGLWNNFAKLAFPVVAFVALAIDGDLDGSRAVAAGVGVMGLAAALAVLGIALRSEAGARRVGALAGAAVAPALRLLRRPTPSGWDTAVERFRGRAHTLLGARWHVLTASTLVGHVSLFGVLLVSLRATGVPSAEVRWSEALAVFAFARLASAVPFTPGGVGVVELALTAGLVATGGTQAPVVAGVLVYRALTYLVQIPLGGVAYLLWRRVTPTDRAAARCPLAARVRPTLRRRRCNGGSAAGTRSP